MNIKDAAFTVSEKSISSNPHKKIKTSPQIRSILHKFACVYLNKTQSIVQKCTKMMQYGIKLSTKHPSETNILRQIKKDWAVLSKDTPVDISIEKMVRQCIYLPAKSFKTPKYMTLC